jgi:prevent-host-death family protein
VRAIGVAEARKSFSSMVNEAYDSEETFVIHSHGEPKAVLMSIEEFREFEATIEEMNDPEAWELLEEAKNDIKEGRTRSAEEILGEALI